MPQCCTEEFPYPDELQENAKSVYLLPYPQVKLCSVIWNRSTINALSILLNYSQNEIVYAWVYSGWCRGPNLKLVILRNSVNFRANTRFASVILVL